ncbi:MAG: hypothetical protein O2913_13750 [Chloroflexi bacterium]|nr:hypothetical protein [Chloroflexota bacterium]
MPRNRPWSRGELRDGIGKEGRSGDLADMMARDFDLPRQICQRMEKLE